MLFYDVKAVCTKKEETEEPSGDLPPQVRTQMALHKRREEKTGIKLETESFCGQDRGKTIFLVDDNGTKLQAGIISKEPVEKDYPQQFFRALGLNASQVELTEITYPRVDKLLRGANGMDFIEDDDPIREKFGIESLGRRGRRMGSEKEFILEPLSVSEIRKQCGQLRILMPLLADEVDRILRQRGSKTFLGHPVHYIIETDDDDIFEQALTILLSALYKTGRLRSKRYWRWEASGSGAELDVIYPTLICGTACLDFSWGYGGGGEDVYADGSLDDLHRSAKLLQKYKNEILTVFRFPNVCNNLKKHLFDATGNCTFVEIQEVPANSSQARMYLRRRAKEKHIIPDGRLYQEVTRDDKGFTVTELNRIFDRWLGKYLKTTAYPQYAEIKSVTARKVGLKAKGDTYEQLQKMVGLRRVKNVIDEAVGYYKAQKLFADRGMAVDHHSMHMVFTGNPGTAKTTVARLFAKIMRDNGILSGGHLIEVGRADLVGKYVGWTAKLVQEAFQKAMGGVLFIDEAYSLVDDRSGLYGDEAINTIVQEMENRREDIVVIFAGYPKEMEKFLARNPGLSSRIAYHIPFEDYSPEELYEIAELTAEKSGVTLSDDVREKLIPAFQKAVGQTDFGNGRYVRNLMEQARRKQSLRLLREDPDTLTRAQVTTLTAADFEIPELKPSEGETHKIGFV